MKVKPNRHGYTDLKRRDPKLYAAWTNYVRTCFDPLDWGYLHANGKSKPRANVDHKNRINAWMLWDALRNGPRPRPPKQLTLARIEDHCAGVQTIYYTSNPRGRYAVLLLDVDDKAGEAGDAKEAFRLLSALFPDIYGQVSTFLKGYHGYLLVDWQGMSLADFRTLCRQLEAALVRAFADHGIRSDIEVKGVPPLVGSDGITYDICGQLAKIPRVVTDEDIRDYLGRPYYTPDHLKDVVGMFAPETVLITINEEGGEGEDCPPPQQRPATTAQTLETVLPVLITINEGEGREREGAGSSLPDTRVWNPCPATRMGNLSRVWVRQHGRVHTPQELLAEYEAKNLNTGTDDDGNRADLAHRQTRWQLEHFHRDKAGTGLRRFEDCREELLALVSRRVTKLVRAAVKVTNRSAYTNEQLAVALYTVEVAATVPHKDPKQQFTVGNNFIVTMMNKVGVAVEGTDETQRRVLSAIKRALVESGLAIWVDEGWTKGRCKMMALGPAHPRLSNNLPMPSSLDPNKRGRRRAS